VCVGGQSRSELVDSGRTDRFRELPHLPSLLRVHHTFLVEPLLAGTSYASEEEVVALAERQVPVETDRAHGLFVVSPDVVDDFTEEVEFGDAVVGVVWVFCGVFRKTRKKLGILM
jgi:hypothetical protein